MKFKNNDLNNQIKILETQINKLKSQIQNYNSNNNINTVIPEVVFQELV